MNIERAVKNARGLVNNIAKDVWPNGWNLKCGVCGKTVHFGAQRDNDPARAICLACIQAWEGMK